MWIRILTSWLVISIAVSLLNAAISRAFIQSELALVVATTTSSVVVSSSLSSLKAVVVVVVITTSASVVVALAVLFVNLAKAIAQRTTAIASAA